MKCHQKGHFQVMCRSNTKEHKVNQIDIQEDTLFLGELNTLPSNKKWSVTLKVNDQNIYFK